MVWARRVPSAKRDKVTISRRSAHEWQFDGEAPVQTMVGGNIPFLQHYQELVTDGRALAASNLTQSDSYICLSGRITGGRATRRILEGARLETHGHAVDLIQLLTLGGWSAGAVSRVSFFNTRTAERDRSIAPPGIVVADGAMAWLRVIDAREFEQSDVIGVVHRTVERHESEEVGSKLASLGQWYARDADSIASLPLAPLGIEVSILRRTGGVE
jgi:hypothetical protein